MIRFLLNNDTIELPDPPTDLTVLDWIRLHRRLTGTKEGCGSGDCGACTVVLVSAASTPDGLPLQYEPANSCLLMIGALHGKQLITVDHLGTSTSMHPVQRALVEHHGSQCGFCTPGFVMSLFALFHHRFDDTVFLNDSQRAHALIEQTLGGNLCRCTGYAPIVRAAMDSLQQRFEHDASDAFDAAAHTTAAALVSMRNSPSLHSHDDSAEHFVAANAALRVHVPVSLESGLRLWKATPGAEIIAGATDKALEVTQDMKRWDALIHLNDILELKIIKRRDESLVIGAGVTLSALLEQLAIDYPAAVPMLLRFGSEQVRSQATVGGNLGSASPIGDLAPMLLSLDATIELVSLAADGQGLVYRTLAMSEYFTGYCETQRKADEWIYAVHIPAASRNGELRIYKVSKRMDDDISTVCAALWIRLDESQTPAVVAAARFGFGGMAAIPKRASNAEQAFQGRALSDDAIRQACHALQRDFSPIGDVRASAGYRMQVAQNLLKRFRLELSHPGVATQIHQMTVGEVS